MKGKIYYYIGIIAILVLFSLLLISKTQATPDSVTIYIYKGWNIISSPFEESLTLSKIAQQCDLTTYKGEIWAWAYDPENGWIQPTGVKKDEGVYILSEENCTVTLTGTPAIFSSRTLKRGWNLISAEKSFEEIKGDCQMPSGYKIWALNPQTQQWFNPATTEKLDQSKGYWVAVDKDCTLGKSVAKKYTNPKGIVMVKKDSNVEKTANEIADERNYVLLSIENSNPSAIQSKIKETVEEYPTIKYLLIIGTDGQIPLRDHQGLIRNGDAVLDSLFYGNMDEDIFVELSVGRIPFDTESDVKNYLEELTIKGSKNYSVFYPIYDKVSDADASMGICLSKEFSNTTTYTSPSKNNLIGFLGNAKVLAITTHGSPGSWAVGGNSFFLENDIPDLHSNRPVIISDSCLSAQELGPAFLKKGSGAFIGAYFETGDFGAEKMLTLSKKIFHGNSLGDSLRDYLNYSIAISTINKKFKYQPTESPLATMDAYNSLAPDYAPDYTIVLFGDPRMTIQPPSSFLPESTIKKQNNEVVIEIPKPLVDTLNENFIFGCYGGEHETIKKGWIKEHWDLIASGKTPKWIIGEFVFPVEGINTIKDGKEIIAGKEFNLEFLGLPFASLVKGNGEQYIVIEEMLTVDSSVFSNSREIILEF